MFEYHGWAVIRSESPSGEVDLFQRLQIKIAALSELSQQSFYLHESMNSMRSMTVSGLRNHQRHEIIEVFQWLASQSRNSYGLLYIHEDEDHAREHNYENVFRVYRLAKGSLIELDDPF